MFSDVLLTVDFDRSLTAPDSTIPQRNLEAIEYFMANGGKFTVNTGRSIPMSQGRLLPEVPVNAPLLLYNGSAGYDKETGEITQPCPIDLDINLLQQLQDAFPQLHVEVQAVDAHYLLHEDAGWQRYCEHNGCPWKYAPPDQIPGPFLKFTVYGEFREVTVSSMYEALPGEVELMEASIKWVMERWGEKLVFFRSATRITDYHALGCSKGNSGRALKKALDRKYLVCVGDAENDLTMMDSADYAYCPADAVIADRYENVCQCGDGAVADVIYKKIPEILNF